MLYNFCVCVLDCFFVCFGLFGLLYYSGLLCVFAFLYKAFFSRFLTYVPLSGRNPNSPDASGPTWLPYTVEHQHYMELNKNMGDNSSKQFLLPDKTNFWEVVLPGLMKQMDDDDGTQTCFPDGGGDTTSGASVPISGMSAVAGFTVVSMLFAGVQYFP